MRAADDAAAVAAAAALALAMALKFELTPTLEQALDAAAASSSAEASELTACADRGTISLAEVQTLSRVLRAGGNSGAVWVHELLQGAAPVLPPPPPKRPPNPELQARLDTLRAAQENREYAEMVGDVAAGDSSGREAAEMSNYKSSMTVGLNLIVSMATMYCVGHYSGGTVDEPHGVRAVVCGLVLMVVTLAVEMILFLIGATRVDAKVAEREAKTKRSAGKGANDLSRVRENYMQGDQQIRRANERRRVNRIEDMEGI